MAFAAAALNTRKSEHASLDSFKLRNPSELGQALQFGLLLALIILATHAARAWLEKPESIARHSLRHRRRGCDHYIYVTARAWRKCRFRSAAIAVLAATMVQHLTKGALVQFIRWRETRHRHCRAQSPGAC